MVTRLWPPVCTADTGGAGQELTATHTSNGTDTATIYVSLKTVNSRLIIANEMFDSAIRVTYQNTAVCHAHGLVLRTH